MGAFTTAALATAAVVGTGLNAYGQYKAGKDAMGAADFNADIYRKQAGQIEVKKKMTAQEYDRLIGKLKGKNVSEIASSGYDFSGSFLEVMKDSLTQARLDKQKELYNLQVQKDIALSSAERSREAGAAAYSSGLFGAGSTILTEGNRIYAQYNTVGA